MWPRLAAHPRLYPALAAAALVCVGVLAWRQYTWISAISDAERDRSQARIRAAVAGLQEGFDETITRTVRLLPISGRSSLPDVDALAERVEQLPHWTATAAAISEIYVTRMDETPDLMKWDTAAQAFAAAAWPSDVEPLRTRARAGPGEPAWEPRAFIRPVDLVILPLHLPRRAESLPRDRFGPPLSPRSMRFRRRLFSPFRDFIIVRLNTAYLAHTLLPRLIARSPLGGDASEFAVQAIDTGTHRVLFASEPGTSAAFSGTPDAQVDILPVGFARRPGPRPREAQSNTWRVLVKHRAGSLEAAIAKTRERNLATSGMLLFIMALCIAALLAAIRAAQRYGTMQLEFVAGVSHELRTPLAVISSSAENLADGVVNDPARVRRYGTVLRAEARRLANMVEQILRFARRDAAYTSAHAVPVSVDETIELAVQACAPDALAAGVAIDREIESGLPLVRAESAALASALRNILENAIVHGRDGGIAMVHAHATGGVVEISIRDRGRGMERAELRHIFDPFYRGRESRERQIHGFGIGLTLSRRIVEAYGGRITIDSAAGRGTTVTVRLPAASEQPVRDTSLPIATKQHVQSSTAHSGD